MWGLESIPTMSWLIISSGQGRSCLVGAQGWRQSAKSGSRHVELQRDLIKDYGGLSPGQVCEAREKQTGVFDLA